MLSPALRKRPIIELGWNAHPWIVADAIRWYVAHPEDRPAIGTPAEHDRLTAGADRNRYARSGVDRG